MIAESIDGLLKRWAEQKKLVWEMELEYNKMIQSAKDFKEKLNNKYYLLSSMENSLRKHIDDAAKKETTTINGA